MGIGVDMSLVVREGSQISQPPANCSASKGKGNQTAGRDQRSRLGKGAETGAHGYFYLKLVR